MNFSKKGLWSVLKVYIIPTVLIIGIIFCIILIKFQDQQNVDSLRPPKVENLVIYDSGVGNTLILSWDESEQLNIVHYNIYRSNSQYFSINNSNFITSTAINTFTDTQLIDDQEYYYKITAVDRISLEGIPSDVKSGIPSDIVAPPKVVGVEEQGDPTGNTINLQWNDLSILTPDLEGYRIYRSTITGFTAGLGNYIGNTTVNYYNDTGLTDGMIYYYRIKAYDEVPNLGTASDEISGISSDFIAPEKVTGLSVIIDPIGNTLNLTWNEIFAPDLANYKVYRSTTPGFTPSPANLIASPSTNHYLDIGLVDDTTYYYRISAVDEVPNEGITSDQANGMPHDFIPPEKVTGVYYTQIDNNTLQINWTSSTAPDLDHYNVYRSNISGFTPSLANLIETPTTNSFIDTNLSDMYGYYYRITALDEVPNEGTPSDESCPPLPDIIPPAKVIGVTVQTVPTGNALNITWDEISAPDLANYKVYRSTTPGFTPSSSNLIAWPTTNYYLDVGLTDDITYYYRISAVDEVPNEGTTSDQVSGTPHDSTPPGKVTGLLVSIDPAGDTLNLTWNEISAPDLANYKIYRSTTSGFTPGPSNLIACPTTNYYLDTTLIDDIPYYYRISAVDEVPNEGTTSDEASGTPHDSTPPGKVTGLLVSIDPAGNTLNLTWNEISASDLTNYKIYRSIISGFTPGPSNLIACPTTNYYLDTTLIDDIPYYYRISTVDEVPNEGTPSDEASGIPHDSTPPAKVAGVLFEFLVNNTLKIDWIASAATDLVHYNVYRSNISGFSPGPTNLIASPITNSFIDNNFTGEIQYYYRISALDEVPNEGIASDVGPFYLPDINPPPKVIGVTVQTVPTGNALNITWNESSAPDLVNYKIYRSTTSGFTPYPGNLIACPTTNYYLDVGLTDDITYYYRISAVDEVPNEGTTSDQVSGTPQDTIAPSAVSGLVVYPQISGNTLNVTWNPVSATDIAYYRVYMDITTPFIPSNQNNVYNATHPNTYYYNNTLIDGQIYYFKVSAVDDDGNEGAIVQQAGGTPCDSLPPTEVTGVIITVVPEGDALNLQWDNLSSIMADVAGYNIYRSSSPGLEAELTYYIATTTNLYYNDTDLEDNQIYYYIITAFDEVPNEGNASSEVNATPEDTLAPEQVANLVVSNLGIGNRLSLSWDASLASDLENYLLYRNTSSTPWILIASPTTNSFTDTGLTDSETYFYQVAAADEVPNPGDNSTIQSGTPTDTTPPAKIIGVSIYVLPEGNKLNITWNPSGASDFQEYRLYRNTSESNWILLANLTINYYIDQDLNLSLNYYYYKVSAIDEVPNEGENSTVVPNYWPEGPPQPVEGLEITVISTGNALNLTWNPNQELDITHYRVYMDVMTPFIPSSLNNVYNVTHPITYYYNDTLIDGQTYYFKVSAVDDDGNEGSITTQVSGTPQDSTPPSEVTGVIITVVPEGEALNLQWDNLSSIVADVAGYNIYRSSSPGLEAEPTYYIATTTNLYYNDTDLEDNQTYYYIITAFDEVPNEGNASSEVNATPEDTIAPEQVVNLVVSNPGIGNRLSLSWDASIATDLENYLLYRNTTSTPWILIASPTANSYTDTGLTDGETYFYQVAAADEVPNPGDNSTIQSGTPTDNTPPAKIIGVSIYALPEGNKLNITWNPSGASDFQEYRLYRNTSDSNWILLANLTINYYIDQDLNLSLNYYYYKVSAIDEVPNEGENSTVVPNYWPEGPPQPVEGLEITVISTGNALNLTWNPNQELDITHYRVYMDVMTPFIPSSLNNVYNVTHPITYYYNDTLIDGQTYYFKVSAVDDDGNEGGIVTQASGTPSDTVAPELIINISISPVDTGNALNLTWTENTAPDLEYYKIYRSTTANFTPNASNLITTTVENYFLDTGLTNGITYYYIITAVDEVPNESPPSDEVSGTPNIS